MQLYHYIPDSWAWTKSSAKSDVSYHEDLSFSSDGKEKYALLVLFFISIQFALLHQSVYLLNVNKWFTPYQVAIIERHFYP